MEAVSIVVFFLGSESEILDEYSLTACQPVRLAQSLIMS